MLIFLLLLGLPLVEIALFVVVGGAIGLWPTLALVVLSALAGVVLVRVNGLQTLLRTRSSLEAGEDPVPAMAHGALRVLAGLLMILPGFITDALGLMLLLPPVRSTVIARTGMRLVRAGRMRAASAGPAPRQAGAQTIDGEFERVDDEPPSGAAPGSSGWTRPYQ
jgi:UPF0716 protein FxsA